MEMKFDNAAVVKTYSVDLVTIKLVSLLVDHLSVRYGRTVSQGEVIRIAVKALADRMQEEEAAEAELDRDEYEVELAAEDASPGMAYDE